MKSTKDYSFVRAKPSKGAISKFIRQASMSGAIWRPYEIMALKNIEMARPVLDIGAGNGYFVKTVFTDKLDYGLDISKEDLKRARQINAYNDYILSDAHKIPLPTNSISTVFSNSVFEHIKNLDEVLSEINRVLKLNGKLILTTHLPRSKKFKSVKLLKEIKLGLLANLIENVFMQQLQLRTLWSEKKWNNVLKNKGFEVENTKVMVSNRSFLFYELFLPFTFLQNRIKLLKILPITKLILSLFKIDYSEENKNGYNIFITAKKINSLS